LKKLDSEIAGDLSIHLIVDNYSTHKHLQRHPRFHLSSALHAHQRFRMDMVERFFLDLSQRAILPGSFGSVADGHCLRFKYSATRSLLMGSLTP
jgi:hypothetical protein